MIAFLMQPGVLVFVCSIIAFLIGKLVKKLPANAQDYLNKIGGKDKVIALFTEAAGLVNLDNDGKRNWVKTHLQELCKDITGIEMPDSIANLIIEFFYNEYESIIGKK